MQEREIAIKDVEHHLMVGPPWEQLPPFRPAGQLRHEIPGVDNKNSTLSRPCIMRDSITISMSGVVYYPFNSGLHDLPVFE